MRSSKGEGALKHLCADHNLKQLNHECNMLLALHNVKIMWKHVKAYQDEEKNKQKDDNSKVLPQAQEPLLNIHCDK